MRPGTFGVPREGHTALLKSTTCDTSRVSFPGGVSVHNQYFSRTSAPIRRAQSSRAGHRPFFWTRPGKRPGGYTPRMHPQSPVDPLGDQIFFQNSPFPLLRTPRLSEDAEASNREFACVFFVWVHVSLLFGRVPSSFFKEYHRIILNTDDYAQRRGLDLTHDLVDDRSWTIRISGTSRVSPGFLCTFFKPSLFFFFWLLFDNNRLLVFAFPVSAELSWGFFV